MPLIGSEILPLKFSNFTKYYLFNHNYNPSHIKKLEKREDLRNVTYVLNRELALRINQYEFYEREFIDTLIKKRKIQQEYALLYGGNTDKTDEENCNLADNVLENKSPLIVPEASAQTNINEYGNDVGSDIVTDLSKPHFDRSINILLGKMLSLNAIGYINELVNIYVYFGDFFGALEKLKFCEQMISLNKRKERVTKKKKEYVILDCSRLYLQLELIKQMVENRKEDYEINIAETESMDESDILIKDEQKCELNDGTQKSKRIKLYTIKDTTKAEKIVEEAYMKYKGNYLENNEGKYKQDATFENNKVNYMMDESEICFTVIDEDEKGIREANKSSPYVFEDEENIMQEDFSFLEDFCFELNKDSVLPIKYKFTYTNPLFRYFRRKMVDLLKKNWNINLFNAIVELMKYTCKIETISNKNQQQIQVNFDLEEMLIKNGILSKENIMQNISARDLDIIRKIFNNNSYLRILSAIKLGRTWACIKNVRVDDPEFALVQDLYEKKYNAEWYQYFKEKGCVTSLMKLVYDRNQKDCKDFPIRFKDRMGPGYWIESENNFNGRIRVGQALKYSRKRYDYFDRNKKLNSDKKKRKKMRIGYIRFK